MQLALLVTILFMSCTPAQREDVNKGTPSNINPERTLLVYLSRTNNTKAVAQIIQKNVGGTSFALGTGTDAAGWLPKAVDFWKSQMIR